MGGEGMEGGESRKGRLFLYGIFWHPLLLFPRLSLSIVLRPGMLEEGKGERRKQGNCLFLQPPCPVGGCKSGQEGLSGGRREKGDAE